MSKTLLELAEHLGGQIIGDPNVRIYGLGTLENATEGQITFLANPKYAQKVELTKATAVILPSGANSFGHNAIVLANPYLAFAKLLTLFTAKPRIVKGIMDGAFVSKEAIVGKDASIYPTVCISDGVRIGDRVTIYPNVTIYEGAIVGDDVTLHAGVSVREGCKIGNRVTIHNGSIIGADGFGYVPDGQAWFKIPQIGIVVIDDDVEIGASTTIDRAALEVTHIGKGTKIDNQVQVAHNCTIGENCVIVAQAGIAGSSKLGKHVTLGGQVAITDHVSIGDNAMIAGQSGVFGNVAPGEVLSGTPAIPHKTRLKAAAVFSHLPEMRKSFTRMEKRLRIVEQGEHMDTPLLSAD